MAVDGNPILVWLSTRDDIAGGVGGTRSGTRATAKFDGRLGNCGSNDVFNEAS
jgi:hypothetical protein